MSSDAPIDFLPQVLDWIEFGRLQQPQQNGYVFVGELSFDETRTKVWCVIVLEYPSNGYFFRCVWHIWLS